MGPSAFAWADRLVESGQSWWQTLPLGPPGYGNAPYNALSSFAGNPLFISPQLLIEDGLLSEADTGGASFPVGKVDFYAVEQFKQRGAACRLEEVSLRGPR